MTTTNKIIKYLAIGLGCFLIFLIIYTVAVGFYGLTELLFSNKKNDNDNLNQNKVCNYASSFNELDIDIKNSSLIIKTGDEFLIETNSENISCNNDGNKLVIKESKSSFFKTKDIKTVTIYIPNNMFLNEIDLETGVGKVNIDNLNTNNLELSFGVGDVLINEIKVNYAKIETGVGKVTIKNGNFSNLDLDTGLGEVNITSLIKKVGKIDTGVGNLNLNLIGKDYKIKVNKGFGVTKINGKEVSDSQVLGNGNVFVFVDGGIGKIDINYTK